MRMEEHGLKDGQTLLLIHGETLSSWMWNRQVALLEDRYRVLTPVLDGHDGEGTFVSIAACADWLIDYLDAHCGGHVLCVCGFALGGQVALAMLAKRPDLSAYGILESTVVLPKKLGRGGANVGVGLQKALMRWKGFARFQSQSMYITDSMFPGYYENWKQMSKETQANLLLEMGRFTLPDVSQSSVKWLILDGSEEERVVKESAQVLSRIPLAKRITIQNCGHGFCLKSPQQYVMMVQKWAQS